MTATSLRCLFALGLGARCCLAMPAPEPDPFVTSYRRARLSMYRGDLAQAFTHFQQCLAVRPVPGADAARIHVGMGKCCLGLEDYDQAERSFRQAGSAAPQWDRPLYWLGHMCLRQGKTAEGLSHFRSALTRNASSYDVFWDRAEFRAKQGDRDGWERDLVAFVRCNPPASRLERIEWAKTYLLWVDAQRLARHVARPASTHREIKTVLLTGFEPFAGLPINPSWESLIGLGGTVIGGASVSTVLLPVGFERSRAMVAAAIDQLKPDLVLCFGLGCRQRFDLETLARRPVRPLAEALAEGPSAAARGPEFYRSRLPVVHMLRRMKQWDIPVFASQSAGNYVCNHVFYETLHLLRNSPIPVGFVHVPHYPITRYPPVGLPAQVHKQAVRRIVEAAVEGSACGAFHDPLRPVVEDVLALPCARYTLSFHRAALLELAGRPRDALVEADAAVAQAPEFAPAYFVRARAHRAIGQSRAALADLAAYLSRAHAAREADRIGAARALMAELGSEAPGAGQAAH